ncbi:MAG: NAD-dependent epimerase/dehydratase family protein [Bryobacteraceae bacterium]|nr:NAD-dependent epimerase/dehydratase family protein [Bryobacteraceae bacterium]
MAKPILVTGASGFLGKHLVAQLRAESNGAPLRILNFGPCPFRDDPALEIVEGSITSRDDVMRAMEGCGQVYHLAGAVSRNPRDKWKMFDLHVEGTRNVCEAALRHGPEKVALVSSSGTVAVSKEPVIHNEDSGFQIEVVGRWYYYLSKIYAEKLALDYVRRHSLPLVITNPALLLGPGDDFGSSTRDIEILLKGQLMGIPGGGMCFVDARDAAAGLIGAMRFGRVGERYLLGGVNWTLREVMERVAEIARIRPPILQPSLGFSLASARVLRRLLPLAGKSFPLDDTTIEMSAHFWYFDSAKAASELGFGARDPIETLRDTVAYIRARQ